MLFEKETLGRQFGKLTRAYFPQKHREQIQELINLANESFTNYITGQVLEAFILGLLCGLGMFLLRLPYALMVGAIVGVTALIPVMGCYIGAITGAFLIVTVSPTKALVFLIFLVILQQVEGNLIYPRVVGGSIGLPGIWVLASVTVGGGLFGIPGMLIGVPLAATIYKWLQRDVRRRLSGSEQSSPQAEASASETAGR
jgi:predicted PurR-regulated permease PerM